MKKNILTLLGTALLLVSCQPKQAEYTINGQIAGDANGKKVYLKLNNQAENKGIIDSTVIADNAFTFKGAIDEPQMCTILVYGTPDSLRPGPMSGVVQARFYLENSPIEFKAHIDSMRGYFLNVNKPYSEPRISGSKTEDLMKKYRASINDEASQYSAAWDEYLKVYHVPSMNGEFNTEQGVALSKKMDSLNILQTDKKLAFIKENPKSVVSFDIANAFIQDMVVELSPSQIEEIISALSPAWNGKKAFEEMKQKAEQVKKSVVGANYTDVPLENEKGETVQLSSIMPKDKYVLLDFWASWCAPCRGEIPHLKHAYNAFKDKKFDIISISFDETKDDWNKALKDEKMTWPQLRVPGGFESAAAKEYNISGIPYCVLVGPDGKIVGLNARGARLDMMLKSFGL